ncbi:ElyC/SanA/YdcF family protein [Mycobacterium dioxanotrophicus]
MVILGFGLLPDGSLRDGLIDRLRQGWAVAQAYPAMRGAVSGVDSRGGRTAAAATRACLIGGSMSAQRILTERTSTSTTSNAAAPLRRSMIVSGTVLITSPDHLRRAIADFLAAAAAVQAVLASLGPVPGPTRSRPSTPMPGLSQVSELRAWRPALPAPMPRSAGVSLTAATEGDPRHGPGVRR